MPQAWDTTTAARLRPDSPELEYVRSRWQLGDPVAFTASTLSELYFGLCKASATLPTLSHLPEGSDHPPNRRGLNPADAQRGWLKDQIAAGLIDVLPFEHRAADIAGALRARIPTPPPAPKRSKGRSKAEGRVAWMMDLQTSATVWVYGYDMVSADAHHPLIARELSALAPMASPLLIEAPPKF
jgi:predicted nucleic acid-binding protein